MPPPRILAAAAAAAVLLAFAGAPQARASIVSGPDMIDPPTSLGPDPFGQKRFFAFYEQQNVVLDKKVRVDRGWLGKGELVSSQYVMFDPSQIVRDTVSVTFDSEILGVVTKKHRLRKSDFLGAEGVGYRGFRKRGSEWRDHYTISADGRTITFRHRAGSPGDNIRIITRGREIIPPPPPPPPIDPPAVPEPGAALLFGLGAALVKLSAGRRLRSAR
jgi:hypothetical protein